MSPAPDSPRGAPDCESAGTDPALSTLTGAGGGCPRWATVVRIALVILGIAPVLTWVAAWFPSLQWMVTPLEAWFEFQCHRDVGRSLSPWGMPLPVCTRCLGIYLGLAAGAVFLRPALSPAGLRIWVLVAVALMLIDVETEDFGLRPMWTLTRLATGLLLAYPVSVTLVRAIREG